jgi:hypothetical protein
MNQERSLPWYEIIRSEREQQGHEIITWDVLDEVVIVSVSREPSCAGVSVYLFGGPDKQEQIKESPWFFLSENESAAFPQLRRYHSCPDKNAYEEVIRKPEPWMQEGKTFISALRNYPNE